MLCFQVNEDELEELYEKIDTSVTNMYQSVKSFLYEGNEYRKQLINSFILLFTIANRVCPQEVSLCMYTYIY